jgi:hypothetical protein
LRGIELPAVEVFTCGNGSSGGSNPPKFNRTFTLNVAIDVLFSPSVAVTVTVVVPISNVDPDTGEDVTIGDPVQLSVASGRSKVTGIDTSGELGGR